MEQEELIELKNNIADLSALIGDVFIFQQDTGRLVLSKEGKFYDLERVLKRNRPDNSEQQRAIELAIKINEGMLLYVNAYGKFPTEITLQ